MFLKTFLWLCVWFSLTTFSSKHMCTTDNWKERHYVMPYSRISRNSYIWHFQFLFDCSAHLKRYILLKTPLESAQWFQGYEKLKGSQNNKKTIETNFSFWLYLTINAADFRLIPLITMHIAINSIHVAQLVLKYLSN